MQLEGSYYAAKLFYDLGDNLGTPTHYKNLKHLKEELLRQRTIEQALVWFNREAKDKRISVFEMQIANSFILEVVDGPQAGLAWIVDHFLDSKNMRKLSGTDMAGNNSDFVGLSCDTFAHYTLEDSDLSFVPADIQGIIHLIAIRNIIGTDCLTLFDLMGHSADGTMGLGNKGLAGIQDFCDQHWCNQICKKFNLEKTAKLACRLPLANDDHGLDSDKDVDGEDTNDDPSGFDYYEPAHDFNDADAENEVTSAELEGGSGKDVSPEAESKKGPD